MQRLTIALGYSAALISAQQVGTLKTEKHPKLTTSKCTLSGGCKTEQKEVVIDSNWRWIHQDGKPINCYTGNKWSTTVCPDENTCTKNCVLEGADAEYEGTYGIKASGNALDLGFVTKGPYAKNVGSRTYLMKDEDTYEIFKLKNKEFTFDVDASTLPCGLNGALYFVQMDADGGKSKYPTNLAGAKYGTGYCDAQCPHDLKFINGKPNMMEWKPSATDVNAGTGKYGSCCVEMDMWEANTVSTAFTAHACEAKEQTRCEGVDCGDNPDHRFDGLCDKNGCDFQTYRLGNTTFYGAGPNFALDSSKKMTVVTQFITADGTDSGELVEIRRFYKQGSKIVKTPSLAVGGKGSYSSLSTDYCTAEVDYFQDKTNFLGKGGMASMGDAFDKGVVLVMSIWDDHDVNMLWLDSTYPTDGKQPGSHRGTCSTSSGKPTDVESTHASAKVTYSNIRFGDIGSTVSGEPSPTPGPSPAPAPGPSPPSPTPAGCPGTSLSSCIKLCPSDPPIAYSACVKECVTRCAPIVLAPPLTAMAPNTNTHTAPKTCVPWGQCAAEACCPNGWECTRHPEAMASQCTPVEALTEAFIKTKPTPMMIEEFMNSGVTRFPAYGLAEY
jgi:cellulose 1,4-beta-cellobiosidase